MAQSPSLVVYMDPICLGHHGVCAIYSETTVCGLSLGAGGR